MVSDVKQLRNALKKAEQFILNGVELGYIRMPAGNDSAHETLPAIQAALAALVAQGAPEWQPIDENTPKDGKIDIWANGIRFTGCYWDVHCGEWRTTGNTTTLVRIPARDAKYWMPLPTPPEGL